MPSGKHRSRRGPQLRLAGLGVELLGAVLGFTLLGLWIDRHYGTGPWGLLVCLVLGLVGGFYNLIRTSFRAIGENRRPGSSDD
jgi:F0F1-type ATP synthase assembly protein I